MSASPFPSVEKTITPAAESILGGSAHTQDELQAAIEDQGALVERLHARGKAQAARQAFESVRLLAQLRTPEAVAKLEQGRGLS